MSRGSGSIVLRALLLATLLAPATRVASGTRWGIVCPHPASGVESGTRGEVLMGTWSSVVRTALVERGYTMPETSEGATGECADFHQAVVVFDRPRDDVLGLLTQTYRQAEFLPSLREVESVEKSEGHSLDRHEIRILFTKLHYHVRNEWSHEDSMMWWSLDSDRDNDIVALDGYWHLYPLGDDRTLAIYASRVNVGSLIPKSVQSRLGRKKLGESLEHFREWVNSNGSYRP
jgi:hypothetical protein